MKIIDILNKIANYEKVKFKILDNDEIRDEIFEVENGQLRNSTCGKWLETKVSSDTWESISSYFLNEEVELIEEEKELHANEIVFNCDNNKRKCVITLDENDLGIDKLHLDNCCFYKENGKWYVKKYDFKTIKLEEDKKIPEKLDIKYDDIKYIGDSFFREEILMYCNNLQYKINEIIDYLQSKGE